MNYQGHCQIGCSIRSLNLCWEQQNFFARIRSDNANGGRIAWKTVRAALISSLATRQIHTYKQEVEGKILPVSVWVAQGWDEETVKKQPSEWSDALEAWTYQVPIKSVSWADTYERVEQRILEHERNAAQLEGGSKATITETFTEAKRKLDAWSAAARQTLHEYESTKNVDPATAPAIASLPFELADVKTLSNQGKWIVKSIRAELPTPKPKAAAKGKASASSAPETKRRRRDKQPE